LIHFYKRIYFQNNVISDVINKMTQGLVCHWRR